MKGMGEGKGKRARDAGAWGLACVGGRDRLVRAYREDGGLVVALARECVEGSPADMRASGGDRPGVTALLADLSLRHERLALPPMRAAKLRKALEQRFASAAEKTQGQEVSCAPYRREGTGDMLAVSVEKEATEKTVERLTGAGYRVERLISPAAAINGLLRETLETDGAEEGMVIVHLGDKIGTVAFSVAGDLILAREFRMPSSEVPGKEGGEPRFDPAWTDHLVGEVGRSLLYFNHQLKGKKVGRILISSDLEGIERILPECRKELDAPVELTADAVGLDPSLFGEGEAARREAGHWVGAIAAAVAGLTGTPDIDLRPEKEVYRVSRRRKTRIGAAALLALALGMAVFHGVHMTREMSLAAEIGAYVFRQKLANREAVELHEIRAARTEAIGRLTFLEESRRPLRNLGESLRALSLASVDGLALEEVEFTGGAGAPLLRVEGTVRAPTGAEAQEQFNRFYRSFRESPAFRSAGMEPIEIEGNEGSGSVLFFRLFAEPEV